MQHRVGVVSDFIVSAFRADTQRHAEENAKSRVSRDPSADQLSRVLYAWYALLDGGDTGGVRVLRIGRDELFGSDLCRRSWQVSNSQSICLPIEYSFRSWVELYSMIKCIVFWIKRKIIHKKGSYHLWNGHPCDVVSLIDCPVQHKQSVVCCVFWCVGTWQSGWAMATPLPMFGHWTSSALVTCRAAEPSCGTE